MDTVPQIFVESVLLCSDCDSIRRSSRIPSRWGDIASSTFKKIYTLHVYVDMNTEKLYAAAQNFRSTLSWDSVDLKFITKFRIDSCWIVKTLPDSWKEISLTKLKRLCELIRPTTEGRPPVRYD
uniref:Uncharacterized protein n=1 Tax=Steinernema glaseri TaxID=37863 RepID=A0A1I8ARX7_9BILA